MTPLAWQSPAPPNQRDHVRDLWLAGKSAGEIAVYYTGATRNAVIGLVSRMKLQRAAKTKLPTVHRKATPNPVKRIRTTNQIVKAIRAEPRTDQPADMINCNRPPLPGTTPVSLLDLPNREGGVCRFPVEGGYCGVASDDRMYCPDHHPMVYNPVQPSPRVKPI